jgi:hypothetical protein
MLVKVRPLAAITGSRTGLFRANPGSLANPFEYQLVLV